MTYTYGLHGSPAVGGGLPGLPQRGASLSGRGDLVKVSLDAFSGVPYGKQVSRADYPSLSDALPPTMLCQAFGCQAIPDATLLGTSSPAWSGDGKYLIGFRSIKSVEDDTISDLFSPTSTTGPASVDENGETFAYRSSSNQVSVVTRSGATFSTPVVLSAGSSDSVVDVTMRPDGLSCVVAIASSSTFIIREYKRANKSTTTWTGPTSVGPAAPGTCRAAQFDRVNGDYLAAALAARGSLELYQRISEVYTLIQTIPGTYSGDTRIAWSPDGLKVAVVRSTSLDIYALESNALILLKTVNLGSFAFPSVCWHDNKTVLFNGEQVLGSSYTNRTYAFSILLDNSLQLLSFPISTTTQGGIASSGKYIATCRDSKIYIRGSTKQVIASIAQPDIYIG